MDYENVPNLIAVIISKRMATLRELEEYYGTEDAYNLLEIITVDSKNKAIASK